MDRHDASTNTEERTRKSGTWGGGEVIKTKQRQSHMVKSLTVVNPDCRLYSFILLIHEYEKQRTGLKVVSELSYT